MGTTAARRGYMKCSNKTQAHGLTLLQQAALEGGAVLRAPLQHIIQLRRRARQVDRRQLQHRGAAGSLAQRTPDFRDGAAQQADGGAVLWRVHPVLRAQALQPQQRRLQQLRRPALPVLRKGI